MYILETHLHTKGNSKCAINRIPTIAKLYSNNGYNGIVCTNHFDYRIFNDYFKNVEADKKIDKFIDGYLKLKKKCEKYDVDVFFGMELSLKGDEYDSTHTQCAEILVFGITPDETKEFGLTLLDMSLDELFDLANAHNWVLVQAHPFRDRTKQLDYRLLHGVEVWNGNPGHYSRNQLAEAFADEHKLIKTSGSDFHYIMCEGSGLAFDQPIVSERDLADRLRCGEYQLIKKIAPIKGLKKLGK